MFNELSVLRDIDEIDHLTVHYRREGKEFSKEKAVLLIKQMTACYKEAGNTDLGFEPSFIKAEDFTVQELYEALVKLREALMTKIGLGKNG